MRLLPEPIAFLWDQGNLDKNLKKHNVTAQEAEEMFTGEPFTVAVDSRHSTTHERRFQALGQTKANRKLFAAFTIRDKKIRIISIRSMSKREEATYEKLEKTA